MTGRVPEDNRHGLTAVRLLHALVAVTLVAIGIETWLVAGLFVPLIVQGGSMAPTLKGAHRAWTCADCRREFICGLESLPDAGMPAVCPWCHATQAADGGVDRPADRVFVLRGALAGAPRRWDLVALHSPEPGGELCVKRVVGLPGERVAIRSGDIWVNGQIARKTLDERHGVSVLVDEMSVAASEAATCRWRDDAGHWQRESALYTHTVDREAPDEEIHWLEFFARPWLSDDAPDVDVSRRTVMDESPYDQIESRTLNPVRDLRVRGEITIRGGGELWLRGQSHAANVLIQLDLASGKISPKHGGRVRQFQMVPPVAGRPATFDWLLADGQVLLVINGKAVVEFASDELLGDESAEADGTCLAIGARGADVTLADLQVWRDVYYTAPAPADRAAEYRLGPDEYLMLGDNSAHSQDSRSWQPGPVPASLLVGRVVRW